MMKVMVLSSSLNPGSKSRVMAWEALEQLKSFGAETDFIDIQDFPLPFAGADHSWSDLNAKVIIERIGKADAIMLAAPIYTHEASSVAKNLIELSAESWQGKTVGLICASGGLGSYMAVMGLVGTLMLDCRCLVLPRFVYATQESWSGMNFDEKIKSRIQELSRELIRVSKALTS